jgi:GntR family transcriptional regulator
MVMGTIGMEVNWTKEVSGGAPATAGELALPLYEVVKRHISDAILTGDWPGGTVLPGEVELARRFGVAVGTVRRALSDLSRDGIVSRRRKTGTTVTGRPPQHDLRFVFEYFRLHRRDGSFCNSTTHMLSLTTRPATEEERRILLPETGGDVIEMTRLRLVDDAPVMFDVMILPAERVPGFPTRISDVPPLLYQHLSRRYGIRVSAIREVIRAELPVEQDQALLRPAGKTSDDGPTTAILVIEEIAYDQAGKAAILSIHRALTDHFRLVNEVR